MSSTSSTMGFDIDIVLRDDCVFSERSATVGGHRGLDYVPGATLLGVAASRLYPQIAAGSFDADSAYVLFHSGKVRFGHGRPVDESGQTCYPTPSCWFTPKGKRIDVGLTDVYRLGLGETSEYKMPENEQPEQVRGDYVSGSGLLLEVQQSYRLKTAIEPGRRRAAEAQLFGYRAIKAGSVFRARITADASVDTALLNQLRDVLSGHCVVGRSRSAEYGGVDCTPGEIQSITSLATSNGNRRITLWLLSDLAAADSYGVPTLCPLPEWLGLPSGEFNPAASFVRHRRYSPWNGYRGGPDTERQVMAQGSVLTFDLYSDLETAHLDVLAEGLGMYREHGLGEVWLNPPLLDVFRPSELFKVEAQSVALSKAAKFETDLDYNDSLIAFLRAKTAESDSLSGVVEQAVADARAYRDMLESGRALRGLSPDAPIGPSASQWGSVLSAARGASRGRDDWLEELFNDDHGICRATTVGWKDTFWSAQNGCEQSISAWLHTLLQEQTSPDFMRYTQRLAREIKSEMSEEQYA